jgi:hypothetical protein
MSSDGRFTGESTKSQVDDDLGAFQVSFQANRYISLESRGFYFNEVTGQTSESELTLNAFGELSDSASTETNINVVTHISLARVQALWNGGLSFDEAIAQGERELHAALGVGAENFDPGARGMAMSILGGDTLPNAYLFAVSVVLAQVAVERAYAVDDAMYDVLNELRLDLHDDGEISERRRGEIAAAMAKVDIHGVTARLQQRLQQLGSEATAPRLEQIFDNDWQPLPDGGLPDGGTDAGPIDGGADTDAGPIDGGADTDAGPIDGGADTDAGLTDGGIDADTGLADGGVDAGGADAASDADTGPADSAVDADADADSSVGDSGLDSGG